MNALDAWLEKKIETLASPDGSNVNPIGQLLNCYYALLGEKSYIFGMVYDPAKVKDPKKLIQKIKTALEKWHLYYKSENAVDEEKSYTRTYRCSKCISTALIHQSRR
ncbi:MAG: hypothetical protein R3A45_02315 [Bdellovibrionota bacterium]